MGGRGRFLIKGKQNSAVKKNRRKTYQALCVDIILQFHARDLDRCCGGRAEQKACGKTDEESEPREHDEGCANVIFVRILGIGFEGGVEVGNTSTVS
jgi:hypothetical protein